MSKIIHKLGRKHHITVSALSTSKVIKRTHFFEIVGVLFWQREHFSSKLG